MASTGQADRDVGPGPILSYVAHATGTNPFTHILIISIAAIISTLASLIYYPMRWRASKAWYVPLCLALNIFNLLLSIYIIFDLVA